MVGSIKRFFCPHDWEVILNTQVNRLDKATKKPYAFTWVVVQRCKKCGKIQKNIIKLR